MTQFPPYEVPASLDEIAARTRAFWNDHPCDGQDAAEAVRRYRYRKEPWLPLFIDNICKNEREVLEVGCGQGTDGLTFCTVLPSGGRYIGIDHSNISVSNAKLFSEELRESLSVFPEFRVADARNLPFDDNSIGAVYSMGVLHHLDDTEKAVSEIHRVLRPGGHFYLGLYNTLSPKVAIAHALRGLQSILDTVTRQDRILFRSLVKSRYGESTGTMFHECFGVPVLKSYTASGMRALLAEFTVESLLSFGSGGLQARRMGLGFVWVAKARKPLEPGA